MVIGKLIFTPITTSGGGQTIECLPRQRRRLLNRIIKNRTYLLFSDKILFINKT